MKVTDHVKQATKTLVSFEILPPLKGKSITSIYEHLDPLMEFKPSWINVTYHRSETAFKKRADGSFEKVEVRKRPGTVGICAAIMNYYHIDAVPRNTYAIDLMKQVVNLNHGIYLDEDIRDGGKTNFCIGVAGYPEKHFEAPNLEIDLQRLKEKVDAGADYVMTQMFFDNKKFCDFVKACRETGINVPIIPGLKPITTKKQLSMLPRTFHVDIPAELSTEILRCKTDADCEKVGTEWLIHQSKELKAFGVPVLHYYTLGKPRVIWNVVKELV